jgi:4-diphosphocytidyl-2-C-methyl-D-erythritol kinase
MRIAMQLLSPAKINLHLRIGPLAADGFHPLLSWMCTVGLHDTIDFEPAEGSQISLTSDRGDLAVDDTNLIVRAGRSLAPQRGAKVHLQKRIPMGGGLGGGSSNGAIALLGFNKLWNLNLPIDRLATLAEKLGSDVPFFLHGPSSVCSGRGQIVKPIARPAARMALLIFPKLSMPTPAVYRRFDEMKLGSQAAITEEPDWESWRHMPAERLMGVLVNDLESPAFSLKPELGRLRGEIENTLGRTVRMSGSGSTLFTLTDTRQEAEEAARRIRLDSITTGVFELCPAAAI